MIVYKTEMETMPNNCMECDCVLCRLPLALTSRGGLTDRVKKEYTKKRHKACPLIEIGGE